MRPILIIVLVLVWLWVLPKAWRLGRVKAESKQMWELIKEAARRTHEVP